MSDFLTPDTNLALMQASQGDTGKIGKNINAARQAKNLEKVGETAKEFEAVFMTEMMKPMFEGIETAAPFGGGKGEEVFQGFLLQEYGKLLSQTGSVGIADQVKQQMIQMQEAQEQPGSSYKLSNTINTEGREHDKNITE